MTEVIEELLNSEILVLKSTPKPKKHRFHSRDGSVLAEAHKHPNGGGWVANTAKVDTSVYVSSGSEVFGNAEITGHVVIRGKCRIYGRAKITGDVTLLGDVVIYDNVQINGQATISGMIELKNDANVLGLSSLRGDLVVRGNALIRSSILAGWGSVQDHASILNSSLEGDFCVCNHAVLNASTCRGRFAIGGTAMISTSTITSTGLSPSYFVRKKLRKCNVPPPAAATMHNELPANDEFITTLDSDLRFTTIIRGRSAVTASELRCALHTAHTFTCARANFTGWAPGAVVPNRAMVLTNQTFNLTVLQALLNENTTTRNSAVAQNTRGPMAHLVQQGATNAPAAAPVPILDPRGSRIIRV